MNLFSTFYRPFRKKAVTCAQIITHTTNCQHKHIKDMEETNSKKRSQDVLNILTIFAVIILLGIFAYKYFSRHQPTHSVPAEETTVIDSTATTEEHLPDIGNTETTNKTQATGQITMTAAEWSKHQKEIATLKATVHTLQAEVKTLKSEFIQLKSTTTKSSHSSQSAVISGSSQSSSISSSTIQTSATSYNSKSTSTYSDSKSSTTQHTDKSSPDEGNTTKEEDITLTQYTHDSYQSKASISLKNNTTHTINSITGRLLYYDMKGNMLDYQDFTKHITIEPDMVKSFELEGYGHKDFYAYYKSKVAMSYPDRKYKVIFQLKNVTYSR